MLDTLYEMPDTREAESVRFDARFAVGLPAEDAAEHRDLADDLTKGGLSTVSQFSGRLALLA